MMSFRFPANLTDKVRWAIQGVIDDHNSMKLPGFAYGSEEGEMECVILPVDHLPGKPLVAEFDLTEFRRLQKESAFAEAAIQDAARRATASWEADETPQGASGVAEEDGA